eukprot:13699141-Alexandrium_andersonii.AAC.1
MTTGPTGWPPGSGILARGVRASGNGITPPSSTGAAGESGAIDRRPRAPGMGRRAPFRAAQP